MFDGLCESLSRALHSRQALCGVTVKSFMSGVVLPGLCRLIHSVALSGLLNLSVPQFTHL